MNDATSLLWSLRSIRDSIAGLEKQREEATAKLEAAYDGVRGLLLTLPVGTVIECYGWGYRLSPAGDIQEFPVVSAYNVARLATAADDDTLEIADESDLAPVDTSETGSPL